MNLIDKAISKYTPSKPIFEIQLEEYYNGGHQACLEKISSCSITKSGVEKETPIDILVRENYYEEWDLTSENKFAINKKRIQEACRSVIRRYILNFLDDNMKQKHPSETKMFKFYNDNVLLSDVPEVDNAIISMYNFLHTDQSDGLLNVNAVKILEFLFIKYKNRYPEKERKQGSRRRRRR